MTETKSRMPRHKVMGTTMAWSFLLLAVLFGARAAGILPSPRDMSPAAAIAFCAALSALIGVGTAWYLVRTDEHDLNANLWAMAWGWISGALIAINWSILHIAGVVSAPDSIIVFLGSSVIVSLSWLWLRFR